MPKLKTGANYSDRVAIKAYTRMGHKAETIASTLGLPLACVKSFMPEGATDPKVTLTKVVPEIPKLET